MKRMYFMWALLSLLGVAQAQSMEFERKSPAKPLAEGTCRIVFEVEGLYGTGYQLLFDADAEAYNKYWTPNNRFPMSGTAQEAYAAAEYKLPETADPAYDTRNAIFDGQRGEITIPAGKYDVGVLNPDPEGGESLKGAIYVEPVLGEAYHNGRGIEFEAGWEYLFQLKNVGRRDECYITPKPFYDVEVGALLSPLSSHDLHAEMPVKVQLTNRGQNTIGQGELFVSYSVDGGAAVEETVSEAAFTAGKTIEYTFNRKADLSAEGKHSLEISVRYAADQYAYNNRETFTLRHHAVVTALPFKEEFSASFGLEESDWQVVDRNADGITWKREIVDATGSEVYAMFCDYAKKVSDDWLITPPVALNAGKASIAFLAKNYSKYQRENIDVYVGQGSDLSTFTKIADFPEQANKEYTPYHANADIETEGVYYFAIRIYSEADRFGFYVDDVEIKNEAYVGTPDLAIDHLYLPVSGCGLNSESLRVKVSNVGDGDIEKMKFVCRINGGSKIEETFERKISGGGSAMLEFATPLDLSREDHYKIEVSGICLETALPEKNTENNGMTDSVFHFAPAELPYTSNMQTDWGDEEDLWQYSVYGRCMAYSFLWGDGVKADLKSRCVHLEAGLEYKISYGVIAGTSIFPTDSCDFKLKIGKVGSAIDGWRSLDSMANAFSGTDAQGNEKVLTRNVFFSVPETGNYAFALSLEPTYFFQLMGFSIKTMLQHDLKLLDAVAFARTLPQSQMGLDAKTVTIAVQNLGRNDENDMVVSVWDGDECLGKTEPLEIKAESTGTVAVKVPVKPYPVGEVTWTCKVETQSADEDLTNNEKDYVFYVSDSVYAYENEAEVVFSPERGFGSSTPISFGNIFSLYKADTLTSISLGLSEGESMKFGLAIYKVDGLKIGDRIYQGKFERGDGGRYKRFDIAPRVLEPGVYYIEVQQKGERSILVAYDATANGYVLVRQNNGVLQDLYKGGYPAIRANFGHNARILEKDITMRELISPEYLNAIFSANEKVEFKVANNTHFAQKDVEIVCWADKERTVQTIDFKPFEEKTIAYEGDFSVVGEHFFLAYVQNSGDENPNNDTIYCTLNSAEIQSPYELDFESCNDFSVDNFNPQWRAVSLDRNKHNYGLEGYDYPHKYGPEAFVVFNADRTIPSMAGLMDAHGGQRFGACFSSSEGQNNDYLVSPKLQLQGDNKLIFYVKAFKGNEFAERFVVMVSTEEPTDDMKTFNTVTPIKTAGLNWEKVEVDLNQYANQSVYVAIRCVSNNQFVFMIDDISVTTVAANEAMDVWRGLVLYPNPAREAVRIQSPVEVAGFDLYDISGRSRISRRGLSATHFQINLNGLETGMYFIRLYDAEGRAQTRKLVVR